MFDIDHVWDEIVAEREDQLQLSFSQGATYEARIPKSYELIMIELLYLNLITRIVSLHDKVGTRAVSGKFDSVDELSYVRSGDGLSC